MSTPEPDEAESAESVVVVRTVAANMTSYNGSFTWPAEGPVEAPDWDPTPRCGGGLHGLLDGEGDWNLLDWDVTAKALLVRVAKSALVELSGKVKFPRGVVLGVMSLAEALCRALCSAERIGQLVRSIFAAADHEKATASAASGASSKLAASGDDSQLAASGDDSQLAASGASSKLAASGASSKLAASGDDSIAMAAGRGSLVKAGARGAIAIAWWDDEAKRPRVAVGYVGENGIKPDTFYRCESGVLVEAGP